MCAPGLSKVSIIVSPLLSGVLIVSMSMCEEGGEPIPNMYGHCRACACGCVLGGIADAVVVSVNHVTRVCVGELCLLGYRGN